MTRCNSCFLEIENDQESCPHCGYRSGQPAKELYHLYPGTVLKKRYQIGQVLGFGGFGITYKAWDQQLETVVAVKEYYPSGLVNRIPGEREVLLFAGGRANEYRSGLCRFLDEAKNMARFRSSKNIVNIFEYFEENNTAYIVMEFLDGITLNDFLKTNELDLDSCMEITSDICDALTELHAQKIIHRDVSPDNIFLCMNGTTKLIDFGAARFSADEDKKMTIVLKPGFAPPEQYESVNAQGPWTDVYALGATLYLMLTRIKPEESTDRKISDELVAPKEINAEISEQVSNTIMKAMALDKHLRLPSVADFQKALAGEAKVIPLEKEKKKRKRNRIIGILMAAAVLAVGSIGLSVGILRQRANTILPDASITLCYTKTGDLTTDAIKGDAFAKIVENFTVSNPNVEIQVVGVGQDTYEEQLQNMQSETSSSVTIFESTFLDSDFLKTYASGISGVVDQDAKKNCFFLKDYKTLFPDENQIPLGFSVPLLYVNTAIGSTDLSTASDVIKAITEARGNIAINPSLDGEIVNKALGAKGLARSVREDCESFLSEEYLAYFGRLSDYGAIQSKMAGRYYLIFLPSEDMLSEFSDLYSISNMANEDEKIVAVSFLSYLLSDNSQEILFVQSHQSVIPLSKNAATIFGEVYSELAPICAEAEMYPAYIQGE